MRILHVAKKFPRVIGGDATAVAALARTQERAGHDVYVVTSNAPEIAAAPRLYRVGPPQDGSDLDRITSRRILTMAAVRRWSRSQLPRLRPDIVHAHAVDVGFAVAPIARSHGIPTVLTCHGVWFPVSGPRSPRGRLELLLIRRGRYGAITSVDRASVEALRSAGFPRAKEVPNGVDIAEFAGPRPADEGPFRFLFAGRHELQKGIDVLLRAAVRVRDGIGDVFTVDVVGEGSLTPKLQALARNLGAERVVRFLGALSRPDLVRAFQSADAFVLPSRFEGFPLAILEAWAAGLPVIATAVGGVPDVCTPESSIVVPPDDPEALARAMIELYRDADRRDALARAGYLVAKERFAWVAIARAYQAIYQEAEQGLRGGET